MPPDHRHGRARKDRRGSPTRKTQKGQAWRHTSLAWVVQPRNSNGGPPKLAETINKVQEISRPFHVREYCNLKTRPGNELFSEIDAP
jgi:hypothetical protein